ncbi:MAG: DUF2443 family protein [Campylobacterales bacterium]|nr:DUF2443 family protein [Campylobacterales bacterium]
MEESLENSIHNLEDSMQEIKILLKMADTNLYSFTAYRSGKTEKPPYLNQWAEDGILDEFENIVSAVEKLEEVKSELLGYLNKKKVA